MKEAGDASALTVPDSDGLPTPRRYWAALAVWIAMAMAVLDSSIANVALPTIAHDLDASDVGSIWIVNAYQIAITMALLPMAALGEIVGYRRVYMVGLALFAIGSLACGLAQDLTSIAVARLAQGFGAAAVMAINGALVRFTYSRKELGRGIGYNALVIAICSAAGPSVAAAILAVASWRWLFVVNVPLGLLSLAIGYRYLPVTALAAKRFDLGAAALNASAFGALFLGCSDFAHGTVSAGTAGKLLIGILAAALLVRHGRGQQSPLVPLDLLRMPILRLSYATSSCAFAAQMIALVTLPFHLQSKFGFDHVVVGLLITPMPASIAVVAPIAGRLTERVSAGLLGGIGLTILTLGLLLLALIPAHDPLPTVIAAMMVCGVGFGLFQTPNNRTMLGVAPPERSGAAAGMLATARLVGQTAGAVFVALLFRLSGSASSLPFLCAAVLASVAAAFSFRRMIHIGR